MSTESNRDATGWDPPPPPPPPPPNPPERRTSWLDVPVARNPEQRRIGGVIAGASDAYGFDRKSSRVAAALGALVLPGIIAVYIASWFLLPNSPENARSMREILTDRRRRPLYIVLAIAAVATGFGSWSFFGGLGWGFALVAFGVILWLSPNFGSSLRGEVAPPSSPPLAGVPASAPRRRRYPVQAIGLAAASLGALVAGIGNSADWWNVSTYTIVLGVMATLITATIVGAIVNRSWFGIPVLLMFSAWTVGLVLTHPNLDGGIGDRTVRPTTVADAEVDQHLGIGRLTLDLTRVPLGDQPLNVDAQVGYGQLRVIVPADTEVRVESDVNAGHVLVNGDETSAGVRRDETTTVPARTTGVQHMIVLDVSVGAGEIKITQAG